MKTFIKPPEDYVALQSKSNGMIENYLVFGEWITITMETTGLLTAELRENEVLDWLAENSIKCIFVRHVPPFTVWFANEEDAVQFKLRFSK